MIRHRAAFGDRQTFRPREFVRVSAGQVLSGMPESRAGASRRIETAHGVIETAGGTLNIGRIYHHGVLAVGTGNAALSLPGHKPIRVVADESVIFSATGAHRLVQSFDMVSAWTRGIFVADNLSLPSHAGCRKRPRRTDPSWRLSERVQLVFSICADGLRISSHMVGTSRN